MSSGSLPTTPSRTVLLFEADDTAALRIQAILSRLGVTQILLGSSREEAGAAVAAGPIDLAIVDLDLAGSGQIIATLQGGGIPVLGSYRAGPQPLAGPGFTAIRRDLEAAEFEALIRGLLVRPGG